MLGRARQPGATREAGKLVHSRFGGGLRPGPQCQGRQSGWEVARVVPRGAAPWGGRPCRAKGHLPPTPPACVLPSAHEAAVTSVARAANPTFPRPLLYAPGNAKGMWSHDAVPPGPNLRSFLLNIQVLETKAGGLRTPPRPSSPWPRGLVQGCCGAKRHPLNTRNPPWKKCSIFVI